MQALFYLLKSSTWKCYFEAMKLELSDLDPQKATLQLSGKPEKKYTLNRFTLRARTWLRQKYTPEKVKVIFENQSLPEISEIAYFLLEEKADFPTIEDFQDACATQQDFINLIQAVLTTIGISEPVVKKISKEYDEKNL